MCTAIVSVSPGRVLLAGVRDEMADRPWQPPARHWPEHRDLIGGRDLLAGGTWLAAGGHRVACVLNGPGLLAAPEYRLSRGALPLRAAAGEDLELPEIGRYDPFHLLVAEPGRVSLASWDGRRLSRRDLAVGTHMVVNHGLGEDLLASEAAGIPGAARAGEAGPPEARWQERAIAAELARLRHFWPRFAAARPEPGPGDQVAAAWREWLPLLNGDGLAAADPAALVVRRVLPDGRLWGTSSVSLVALDDSGLVRYDFTPEPGRQAAWYQVPADGR